jgi:hypothetical protein
LDRKPVAIAAGHLDDRFQAFLYDDRPGANAGHAYDSCLVIRDINRIAVTD